MVQRLVITEHHKHWAKAVQRKWGRRTREWLDLIRRQQGRCALSGAPLLFDVLHGTAIAGGPGAHPLYAVVAHVSPGLDGHSLQMVSHDLNDLKGHLPVAIFAELRTCPSWRRLMQAWRAQAIRNPRGRRALRRLWRSEAIPRQAAYG